MNAKKILASIIAVGCMVSSGSYVVTASSSNIPAYIQEIAKERGAPIVVEREGVFAIGNDVYIDVELAEHSVVEVPDISPYGIDPPSTRDLWNWSDGTYEGTYESSKSRVPIRTLYLSSVPAFSRQCCFLRL